MSNFHSPDQQHQVSSQRRFVDTRSEFTKYWQAITRFEVAGVINTIFIFLVFFKPWTFAFCFLGIAIVTLRAATTKNNKTLPIKLPIELKKKYKDYNAPYPGRIKYKRASGTVMLGNTRTTGQKEIWQEGADLLTHGLVIGTTGAGKTEMLIGLVAATTFCQGGGLFYLDPKAGNDLLKSIVTLCKMFGRYDDLRVMNYKRGGETILEKHYLKYTNSFNPFAQGTDQNIFQVLGTLIPSDAGQNQSFLNSAIELMKAALPALCELRDRGYIQLTPGLISEYMNLVHLSDLIFEPERNVYVPSQNEKISVTLSDKSRKPLEMYFNTLQLDNQNRGNPSEKITSQFGYAKSYYGEPLSNLAANYGHMYDHYLPEISLEDTIFNNRILLSMLPAMENPPPEQKNLGKITLATAKQAMSLGLGAKTEGSFVDVIENLPVDKKTPFMLVADEYAEVAVPGFAVAATQGRSLGISVTFGSQDLEGLIRADKEEAGMIFANTLNKWLMRTQDPDTTWKKFKDLASTITVTESTSFKENSGLSKYKREISASVREVDKLHFQDIVEQQEGEAHLFERGNVHKINVFYHGFTDEVYSTINFRYNRLLPILPPSDKDIEIIKEYIEASNALETAHGNSDIYPDLSLNLPHEIIDKTSTSCGLFLDAITKYADLNETSAQSNATPSQEGPTIDTSSSKPAPKQTPSLADTVLNNDEASSALAALHSESSVTKPESDNMSVAEEMASTIADSQNHWLFSSNEENGNISIADQLAEKLQLINKEIYGEEDTNIYSTEETEQMVRSTADNLPYTSKPKVEPKKSDLAKMWEIADNLFQ